MELRDKQIVIVGLARSGLGAARLCVSLGAEVTVTDLRQASQLSEAVDEMRELGVTLELGQHRDETFRSADMVVISPGVPPDQPQVRIAVEAGVQVIGELELAAAHLSCPLIAITGTNGKSTTTTFAGELLRAAGLDPFVGGNLGLPLSDGILDHPYRTAVVEVSSFQLETAPSFHPQVAAMLNLSEDHLDRYASFDEYLAAKRHLFDNLEPDDVVIYNAADPLVSRMVARVDARHRAFSLGDHGRNGVFYDRRTLVVREAYLETPIELRGYRIPGLHNIENLMAAVLCAMALGAGVDDIATALPQLSGLPHRMEWIRGLDGADWFNDSKGTNVASTTKTVEGLGRPSVLLLGGKDKGGDYGPLVEAVRRYARAAILYGQAAPIIAAALDRGGVPYHRVEDLAQAVPLARELARPGDAVLLSPACSSFDQFRDFEQRGDVFRELVEALS